MLADLVERSRQERQLDTATERRVWESAFRALAVVVVHYRVIALVSRDGSPRRAGDRSDREPATAETSWPTWSSWGRPRLPRGRGTLGAPARFGARSFLIYATPRAGGGAIVVASDAALLLRSVAWPQLPAARLFVTDPSGVIWSGCENVRRLSVADARSFRATSAAAGAPLLAWTPGGSAAGALPRLGDLACRRRSAGRPATGSSPGSPRRRPSRGGSSRSSRRIVTTACRRRDRRGGGGDDRLRQQRRATVLANQLRYARARAKAQELENQLIRADRLITVGVMATEIAHEVGTPLAVVRGRAEQIWTRLDSSAARGPAVIIRQVDQISSTIRQLLDFSRRSPLEKRSVALDRSSNEPSSCCS